MPPAHILNAPTGLMRDLGYGENYQYDPDTADGFSGAGYLADGMDREAFYRPGRHGYEAQVSQWLEQSAALREQRRRGDD